MQWAPLSKSAWQQWSQFRRVATQVHKAYYALVRGFTKTTGAWLVWIAALFWTTTRKMLWDLGESFTFAQEIYKKFKAPWTRAWSREVQLSRGSLTCFVIAQLLVKSQHLKCVCVMSWPNCLFKNQHLKCVCVLSWPDCLLKISIWSGGCTGKCTPPATTYPPCNNAPPLQQCNPPATMDPSCNNAPPLQQCTTPAIMYYVPPLQQWITPAIMFGATGVVDMEMGGQEAVTM